MISIDMGKEKSKKERADKYEDKLHIDGTLDDVLKASVTKKKKEKDS